MQNLLPKIYHYINNCNLTELSKLSNNINLIYRNYDKRYKIDSIINLRDFCRKNKRKLFLSNNIELALSLKLDGVYIPSFNKRVNYSYINNKPKRFKVIGSAHSIQEILLKEKQGCEEIFVSPIFKTHKSKKFLGIIRFNLIANNSRKRIIALGGINNKNYKRLKLTKSIGFASIDWIKKNGPRDYLRPFYKV